VEHEIPLHEAGRALGFNPETLGVDAVATDDHLTYIGHTERRTEQGIDVLLWPEARVCPLSEGGESAYPGPNGGQALGFSERLGLLLVAGENVDEQRAGSALVLDIQTGELSPVERAQGALNTSRAFATVTPFGEGLLVAGGTNPLSEATSIIDARSGEIYSPRERGFAAELVDLVLPRAHHAALELPATGETLLIGGVVPNPNGGPGQELLQLEAVSPTHGASISDLGRLYIGRVDPTALVLTDGRIFVGGGHLPSVEASEMSAPVPVGQVEWFAPHAGPEEHVYAELPARGNRTFAALPGGGVLTVASCPGEPAALRRDCVCVTSTGAACEDEDPQAWVDAFWIGTDLVPRPVGFTRGNVAPCPTPDRPQLLSGSDGSPWLAATRADGSACLWRFEAWPEDPDSASDDPTAGPRFVPTLISLDPAPDPASPLLSFAPDAFVWTSTLGDGGLHGARLGHRGPLTRDDGSLLDYDAARPYRPAHLTPDRFPSGSPDASTPWLRYEHDAITLVPAEPPLTLFVTDTLYDDVSVEVEVDSAGDDAPPEPPLLVFASKTGETSVCSFGPERPATPPVHLLAERLDRQVTLTVVGTDEVVTCEVPTGPLTLGVRAGTATTRLTSLLVKRR
jgi:hypothetical protein